MADSNNADKDSGRKPALNNGMGDVLLVEDNDNDVDLTLHSFKKHHLANSVDVVRDGEKALEYLFATGEYAHRKNAPLPKVVLLDLKLPRVDGLEVLRQVKADERTKDMPVVILTSSTLDRDIKQAYKLGANSYIVKPVDFPKFSKSVAEVGMYWLFLNTPPGT